MPTRRKFRGNRKNQEDAEENHAVKEEKPAVEEDVDKKI